MHELAILLGIPTGHTNLASYNGNRGVISLSVASERLEHGNELLAAINPSYDKDRPRNNPGYTVAAVKQALEGIAPPAGWAEPGDWSAFDVWSGYLTLDAWVAGRDRHHENWGAVRDGHRRRLAPSFDHGNALGFQERDTRKARLTGDEVGLRRWAGRGTCPYFAGQPSLLDLAREASDLAAPTARRHWLRRLAQADVPAVAEALSIVPV